MRKNKRNSAEKLCSGILWKKSLLKTVHLVMEAKFMHKRISLLPEGIKCRIQRVQFIENRNVHTVTATLQAADQPKLMFCKTSHFEHFNQAKCNKLYTKM